MGLGADTVIEFGLHGDHYGSGRIATTDASVGVTFAGSLEMLAEYALTVSCYSIFAHSMFLDLRNL